MKQSGVNTSLTTTVSSSASESNSNVLTYEKLAEMMKKLAADMPPVVTTFQLPPLHPRPPVLEFESRPRSIFIDYLSLIPTLMPTQSSGRIYQQKSRAHRGPQTMSDTQLAEAEQRWVPGVVLRVDGDLCVPTGEHIDEVTEWVNDCCEGRVSRSFTSQNGRIETFRFTFDSDTDKVMFTLRWC